MTNIPASIPTPRVSVVIPLYNNERFLPATLESLLAQEAVPWECIIVNDGSKDGSAKVAEAYASRDARIRVIHQKNQGRALALRNGCSHLHPGSDYLFFLDSDDLLHPHAFKRLSAYLDEHPAVGLVSCDAQLIDAEGKHLEGEARSRWGGGAILPRSLPATQRETPFVSFYCATGQGPFALHRRSIFEQTDGFDPRFSQFSLHEDTDIFCQMALRAEVHFLPQKLYFTRRHGNNVSSGSNPRIQTAYGRFRAKWDNYVARNERERALLSEASHFYRTVFEPCRNVKVSMNALREAVAKRRMGQFSFACRLFFAAARASCRRWSAAGR